jgi:hypothetical protein
MVRINGCMSISLDQAARNRKTQRKEQEACQTISVIFSILTKPPTSLVG